MYPVLVYSVFLLTRLLGLPDWGQGDAAKEGVGDMRDNFDNNLKTCNNVELCLSCAQELFSLQWTRRQQYDTPSTYSTPLHQYSTPIPYHSAPDTVDTRYNSTAHHCITALCKCLTAQYSCIAALYRCVDVLYQRAVSMYHCSVQVYRCTDSVYRCTGAPFWKSFSL